MCIRDSRKPRTSLFIPTDVEYCPIPLRFVDVTRCTKTGITEESESLINDVWSKDDEINHRVLSEEWTGRTIFQTLKPLPPPGMTWVEGRLTRKQKTERPDTIIPEIWMSLSKKQKKIAKRKGEEELAKREAARNESPYLEGRSFIKQHEIKEYDEIMEKARNTVLNTASFSSLTIPVMLSLIHI